ncbi:MAG: PA14 domain-containing protein [Phycisphaerales bacterium]
MIAPPRQTRHTRRATAVVGVIIALVLLQLAVTGIVVGGGRDPDLSVRRIDTLRAFYASEGAVNVAVREFSMQTDESGDGGIGSHAGFALSGSGGSVTATPNAATGGTTLSARGTAGSAVRTLRAEVVRRSTGGGSGTPGLKFESWNLTAAPSAVASVPFSTTPTFVGTLPNVNWASQSDATARWLGAPTSRWGIRFSGTISLPSSGAWGFGINSDDGSQLLIDGALVVNNDGLHGMTNRTGTATLSAGAHTFEIRYFENGGNNGMIATWRSPTEAAFSVIPATAFTSDPVVAPAAVHTTITLNGDPSANATNVDGFDPGIGAYGGLNISTTSAVMTTNSTASSAWQMNGRARLQGNARVGPGGNPATVISLSGTSSITGTQTAAASRTAIFTNPVPTGMPSSSGALSQTAGTLVINGNRRYSSFLLGGNASATVTSSCIIRVDGDLNLEGSATFTLLNGAVVTFAVGGNVSFIGNSSINLSPGLPDDLTILVTGSGRTVQIIDRSRVVAGISNPLGTFLVSPDNNPTGQFYGRYVGGTLQTNNRARIHLAQPLGASGGGASSVTVITDWAETP